jgi:hypothetical protein
LQIGDEPELVVIVGEVGFDGDVFQEFRLGLRSLQRIQSHAVGMAGRRRRIGGVKQSVLKSDQLLFGRGRRQYLYLRDRLPACGGSA